MFAGMFDPESLISATEIGDKNKKFRRSSLWSLGSMLRPASPPTTSMMPAVRGFNLGSLMESGKALTDKVQSMVMERKKEDVMDVSLFNLPSATSSVMDGSNTKLLESVSVAFERQENINRTNAKLSKLNYMVNVANFVKHKQVESAINKGQKHLAVMNTRMQDQENTIDGLNTSLCDLSMEVEHQRHLSERLTSSLHSQQHLLQATIMESRRELEKQHYMLSKQQAVVDSLLHQKLRQDFLVDSGIVVLAVYITNTILVDYPIQLAFSLIPKPKLKRWLQQFSKLVIIFQLVSIMKNVSIKCGVHTSSGTCAAYLQQMATFVMKRMRATAAKHGLLKESSAIERNRFLDIC